MIHYRAIIIDDDIIHICFLEAFFKKQCSILHIGTASNLDTGYTLIMKEHPDLVFLDVVLGHQNGLEFYQEIRPKISWTMKVIINTGYKQYIIDNKYPDCFDYLVKPFTFIEFSKVINRFLLFKKIQEENIVEQKIKIESEATKTVLIIDTLNGKLAFSLITIKYFIYNNSKNEKRWYMVLVSGTKIALKQKIYNTNIRAYSQNFSQTNDSFIINIHFLVDIDSSNLCVFLKPYDKENKMFIVKRAFIKQTRQKIDQYHAQ
jgi:DNA-binding LytR/AlgR family response regulator